MKLDFEGERAGDFESSLGFSRRFSITWFGAVAGGLALTIVSHLFVGAFYPEWYHDGQYVFMPIFLYFLGTVFGAAASSRFKPANRANFWLAPTVGGGPGFALGLVASWPCLILGLAAVAVLSP